MPSGEVWVIVNPDAGGGRALDYARAATTALAAISARVRVITPGSAAETTQAARDGGRSGAAAVVACGGDGTVHAVLQGLVGTATALDVLPAGSGDDIATALGNSAASAEAAAQGLANRVADGTSRLVDVAEVITADGVQRYFLGVMSTGFDSSVNERANRLPRLGGQRYNVAIVRELASFRPLDYAVTMDGTTHRRPGMLVSIGNGSRYGGGMRICPAAQMDDGLLDVTWLGAVGRPTLLRVFPKVFSGTHVHHPAVTTYRARELRIEAPGQLAYADGERIGPLPVDVRVHPRVLRVLGTGAGLVT